jgi:hypothetical protein
VLLTLNFIATLTQVSVGFGAKLMNFILSLDYELTLFSFCIFIASLKILRASSSAEPMVASAVLRRCDEPTKKNTTPQTAAATPPIIYGRNGINIHLLYQKT